MTTIAINTMKNSEIASTSFMTVPAALKQLKPGLTGFYAQYAEWVRLQKEDAKASSGQSVLSPGQMD